jgi:hypothetical protein
MRRSGELGSRTRKCAPSWSACGGDEVAAGEGIGAPLGGGGLEWGVVGGLEEVDFGGELVLVSCDVDATVGVEGDDGVVLEDDAWWRGESLDVEDGEADTLAGELGLDGFGLTAPESVETIRAEDVWVAFGVEVEGVTTIELDGHDDTSCWGNGSAE